MQSSRADLAVQVDSEVGQKIVLTTRPMLSLRNYQVELRSFPNCPTLRVQRRSRRRVFPHVNEWEWIMHWHRRTIERVVGSRGW